MRKIAVNVGIGAIAVLLLLSGIFVSSGMPDHAMLLLDVKTGIYYAPPFVREKGMSMAGLVTVRSRDIEERGYHPDERCVEDGYFEAGDFAPLPLYYFKKFTGLSKSRWNEDGTWNW